MLSSALAVSICLLDNMADDSGDFKIFDLLSILDTLKHLKRTGWVKNKVK